MTRSRKMTRFLFAARSAALVALLATSTYPSPSSAQDVGHSTLNLDVIQCPMDRSEAPSIEVAMVSSGPLMNYSQLPATTTKVADGLFRLSSNVPAGNISMRVKSSHCSGTTQAGLMDGRERSLSIATAPLLVVLSATHNALMGLLPIQPGVAYLVSAWGTKRVMDVQHGVYYIERIQPGHYTMLIELSAGLQTEIPLDLSRIGYSDVVRRDIDIREIRTHLGESLLNGKTNETCHWCY
jgi:hypothetical protein